MRHWPSGANTFYTFNSAGLEVLEEAQQRGLHRIIDQITAPWPIEEGLLQEERAHWPDWESDKTIDSDWAPLAEREEREWELANLIICGSEFVKSSIALAGGPSEKCVVVPYGVSKDTIRTSPRDRHEGSLRVLFIGNQPLRKGLPYLIQAARQVGSETAVFRAVGKIASPEGLETQVDIRKPVPRGDIRREYDWADLLVAPSISEGSTNVCYEALAQGIPVITTENAGSIVRDGQDGFIVPIRSSDAISEKVAQVAASTDLWRRLSSSATARAREFTWATYAGQLAEAINSSQRTALL